jgi:hypothetical protein
VGFLSYPQYVNDRSIYLFFFTVCMHTTDACMILIIPLVCTRQMHVWFLTYPRYVHDRIIYLFFFIVNIWTIKACTFLTVYEFWCPYLFPTNDFNLCLLKIINERRSNTLLQRKSMYVLCDLLRNLVIVFKMCLLTAIIRILMLIFGFISDSKCLSKIFLVFTLHCKGQI